MLQEIWRHIYVEEKKQAVTDPVKGMKGTLKKLFRKIEDKVMYLECVKFSRR